MFSTSLFVSLLFTYFKSIPVSNYQCLVERMTRTYIDRNKIKGFSINIFQRKKTKKDSGHLLLTYVTQAAVVSSFYFSRSSRNEKVFFTLN